MRLYTPICLICLILTDIDTKWNLLDSSYPWLARQLGWSQDSCLTIVGLVMAYLCYNWKNIGWAEKFDRKVWDHMKSHLGVRWAKILLGIIFSLCVMSFLFAGEPDKFDDIGAIFRTEVIEPFQYQKHK
jgi:hypothetical protein